MSQLYRIPQKNSSKPLQICHSISLNDILYILYDPNKSLNKVTNRYDKLYHTVDTV